MHSIDHCFEEYGVLIKYEEKRHKICETSMSSAKFNTIRQDIVGLSSHTSERATFRGDATYRWGSPDSSGITLLMPSSLDVLNSSDGLADRSEHSNLPRLVSALEKAPRPYECPTVILEVLKENGEDRATAIDQVYFWKSLESQCVVGRKREGSWRREEFIHNTLLHTIREVRNCLFQKQRRHRETS